MTLARLAQFVGIEDDPQIRSTSDEEGSSRCFTTSTDCSLLMSLNSTSNIEEAVLYRDRRKECKEETDRGTWEQEKV